MDISAHLPSAYIKVKHLLKENTMEEIVSYIAKKQLIISEYYEDVNEDQYEELYKMIVTFCKRISNKHSCLISAIIYANIMAQLGKSVKIHIGFVKLCGRRYAHAWVNTIDLFPLELDCIVKTFTVN